MHSIEVKSKFDRDEVDHWVNVTWTIKTTYSFKLCYPDGLEYDLPRSSRSVNQFILFIDKDRPVFKEHWQWMIKAVEDNYPYEILFHNMDGQTKIAHTDKTVEFSIASNGDADEFRFYMPLEYVRDDFLNACRKMIEIYESEDYQRIFTAIQTTRYKPVTDKYSMTKSLQEVGRWKDIQAILEIHPKEFPIFMWIPDRSEILYCISHSHPTRHIYITPQHSKKEITRLHEWLNSNNDRLCFDMRSRKPFVIFERHDRYVIVINHVEDYGMYDTFNIPNVEVSKLKDYLSKLLSV